MFKYFQPGLTAKGSKPEFSKKNWIKIKVKRNWSFKKNGWTKKEAKHPHKGKDRNEKD